MSEYKVEFKTCPFCGTKDRVHARVNMGPYHYSEDYYHVECAKCDISTGHFKKLDDAIARWNHRQESRDE